MLLKEICTPDVVLCSSGTRVLAAARIMRQKHVGDLVVVDDPDGDQTPLGMVTDRDIVVEVLGKELDPRTVTIAEIMRKPAVIANEYEDVSQALDRMKAHGVRRIPIMGEHRKLVGIFAVDDLLRRPAGVTSVLADIVDREQGNEHRGRR
jgi:CBS domain-containing protein